MSGILAFIGDHVVEMASVLGIISAFLLSTRQNALTSRAIRAQSFVNLLALESDLGFQKGIRAITSLKPYTSFADFDASEEQETKQAIYDAVGFLNFMAVLGEDGYLHIQDSWDVYFWSYRQCFEKLLPWWLDEYRISQPNVFPSFERACRVTSLVSPTQVAGFERQISTRYVKKYHKISKVARAKLRGVLAPPGAIPMK